MEVSMLKIKGNFVLLIIAIVFFLVGLYSLLLGEPQPVIDTPTGITMYYTNPVQYGIVHTLVGALILSIYLLMIFPKEKKA